MRAYLDSDILIWHLRGDKKALKFFTSLRDSGVFEMWTGAMQRAEVLFYARPEEEEATELFLSLIKTAPVNQEIVDVAAKIFRRWNPSHGIDVHDAILAATAMQTGGKIFSKNIKHYPMPNLLIAKAW